jgi:hypothetical protein
MEYTSGTVLLWHPPGKPIVPILWVLVRYPDGRRDPESFLCTDPSVALRTCRTGLLTATISSRLPTRCGRTWACASYGGNWVMTR